LSVGTKVKAWWNRRRRKPTSEVPRELRDLAELREFVYLDDVSVYSLLASLYGAVPKEFTDTETASLRNEFNAGFGAAGPLKADIGAKRESGLTQQSQVVRMSNIQSTFKELYDLQRDSFVIAPIPPATELPPIELPPSLLDERLSRHGWIIDPELLCRGDLIELQVELEAEAIYRMTSVISSLMEIMRESPQLLARYGNDEATQMIGILQKLLAGLVPVRGRAVDYQVLELDHRRYLVHVDLLPALAAGLSSKPQPLFVVGVTEERLYWKDIRRVLYSNSSFRVLCRIGRGGLNTSWTPVKSVDMLRSVSPSVAEQIAKFSQIALDAINANPVALDEDAPERKAMRSALIAYANEMLKRLGKDASASDLVEIDKIATEGQGQHGTIEERRAAFGRVDKYLANTLGLAISPDDSVAVRTESLRVVGFGPGGFRGSSRTPAPHSIADEFLLDTELIAIYW
jgi:hypothetical protein